MAEAAVKIRSIEGKSNISADLEKELWDIHQSFFGIMGMLRMIRQSAEADSSESQAAADIVEVLGQYIPNVDALRIRLDTAICQLKRGGTMDSSALEAAQELDRALTLDAVRELDREARS